MSLAENLLNSLETTNVTNSYSPLNEEPHIVVGADRNIIVPQSLRKIAVTGDTGVETVTFDCVRYWDGNDLSTFAIYLNYVLPDRSIGTYIPKSITANDGEDAFHFDWEINRYMTKTNGTIAFSITAIKTKLNDSGETVVDKQWGSFPNTECSIVEGVDIANVPDNEETADILAQITEILEKIQGGLGGDGGTVADNIPEYVKNEAESVINKVIAAQGNRTFTFAAITDMHYGSWNYYPGITDYSDGIKHACQALKYIDERIKLDAVAILGDYTDGMANNQFETAVHDFKGVNAVLDKLRFAPNLRLQGNHDFVAEHSPIAYRYIGAYNDGGVEWGNFLGGYFRKDFTTQKLRVICLNTSESGNGSVHCTDAQYNWFVNSLDLSAKADASDWQILILSHIPLDMWAEGGNYKFAYILNAYQEGTAWTGGAVSCDFSNGKNAAKIIGSIHGHVHNLRVDKLYLGNIENSTTQIDVWRIATPNACFGAENKKSYTGYYEDTDYTKTAESATDTAFCIYCIDLDTCTIKAVCYGAGYERELNYETGVVGESYSISNILTNVTNSNTAKNVDKNATYSATLTATSGNITSVTVTMGGVDITATAYSNGNISIAEVTGNVIITAVAEAEPEEPEEPAEPTNVLATSTDADGNIYNGKGYKENTRWSTSSAVEKEYTGVYITGYIQVTYGDVIRLKNITFSGDGTETDKIQYFTEKGSWQFVRTTSACANAKYDGSGNLIEFTSDLTGFIRVQASSMDSTSIVTINEPIE